MSTTSTTPLPASPEALLEHHDFVRGIAHSLLFDDHLVDDVVQQTWLAAIRHGPRSPGAARAWLGKVVRSRASNLRRDERRRRQRESEAARRADSEVPGPEVVQEREAVRAAVVQAVMELGEPYRSTVLLRYFDNRRPSEIARRLGVPPATVRTRLRRALAILRGELDARHGGDRRAWCLPLVPLAAGHRLATTVAGTQILLWLSLVGLLTWGGWAVWQPFGPAEERVAVDAVTERRSGDGGPPLAGITEESAAAPVERRPLPGGRPGEDVAASVAAAMVGFQGRLLTPEGSAAPDRRVEFLIYEPHRLILDAVEGQDTTAARLNIGRFAGVTDDAGRFVVTGLWPHGHYLLRTGIVDSQALTMVVAATPPPGELVDLGDLRLTTVSSVSGTVVDGAGGPVGGALVWASDVGSVPIQALLIDQIDPAGAVLVTQGESTAVHAIPRWARSAGDLLCLPQTYTDESGRFVLAGMSPGVHHVVIRSPAHEVYSRGRVELKEGEERDLGKIRLRDGYQVRGCVLDAVGGIVAGAQVMVAPRGMLTRTSLFGSLPQIEFGRAPVRTDGNGRFCVPGLPRAALRIAFRPTEGDPWMIVDPSDPGADHELRLPATGGIEFGFGELGGATPAIELYQGHLRGELILCRLAAPVDLTQRLRLVAQDVYTIDRLTPGAYTLVVRTDRHALEVVHFSAPSARLQIALRQGVPLRVLVADPGGRPLEGAQVIARLGTVPEWARSVLPTYAVVPHWDVVPTFVATTGEAGEVDVATLPPGDVWLTVVHPAFGSVAQQIQLPRRSLEVRFEKPATLRGRILDGDQPADPTRWVVSILRQDGVDREGPTSMQRLVEVDAESRFLAEGLTPGDYIAELIPSPSGLRSVGAMRSYVEQDTFGIFSSPPHERITLAAGSVGEIEIQRRPGHVGSTTPGARLHGTAFLDGRPAAGYRLVPRSQTRLFASHSDSSDAIVVDAGGRFDAGRLRHDRYRVSLLAPSADVVWQQVVEIRDGADQALEIDVRTARLHGVVTHAGPVEASITITASGASGVEANTMAGPTGSFLFEALPADVYALVARSDALGQALLQGVAVPAAGGGEVQVRMELVPYTQFSGRLDPSRFGLLADVNLSICLYGNDLPENTAQVQADGSFTFARVPPGTYGVVVFGGTRTGKTTRYRHLPVEVEAAGGTVSQPGEAGRARITIPPEGLRSAVVVPPRRGS